MAEKSPCDFIILTGVLGIKAFETTIGKIKDKRMKFIV